MKRFFATLLVVIMLVSMVPATTLAATQYATVVGGWLRLRAGASFEADTITSYYTDTVVEILGTSGAWYRVKTPDGRTGYMYSDYLKLGAAVSGTANAYVTSHNGYGVRLRKGPGTGYRVIKTYAVGTPVTVLERGSYWSRININGTVGYMMSQFLNFGGSSNGNGNESVLCYATIWSGNGYGVRLRTGPSKTYGKIGVYSVGTVVAVLEKGTTWDRIRVGSRTGWMMNEFLHYQNNNEVTSVTLNTLNPTVGTVMSVQAMSPSKATVSYAWIVDGTVKGTNSTYTVSSADVGKSIQLKITGTGSYSGSALSALTSKVISNTQISGLKLSTTAPVVGDVIKAAITPSDASVAYAWKVGGYQVSNNAEYTVAASDVGKTIELIVTGTGSYSGTLSVTTSAVVATSALTGVSIRNDSNSTVGAAPMVGDQLTAVTTPAQATATYQWKRNGSPISGATGVSYTLTDSDLGAQMSVTVTGTGAYSGEKTASISDAVAARPVAPSIDDYAMPEAMVGQTYATQLIAQGGGEIAWTITSGTLPEGLSLSETGAITGTPAKDGTSSFTVKATNAAGSDEKTFTITVVPVAKPELTVGSLTIPAQTEGYAQPAPSAVSITNVGKADANLQLLWTAGTNGDCFIVNENGSSVISAGETDTTWTVQPKAGLAAGTYTADFIVRYDDNATASAAVTFTVNAKPVAPETPVTTYALTVSGGADTTGKGSYQAGETVTITADAAADGFVFSGWTASADVTFADASAATTTLTMPASDVTVTANYTAITPPEEQPETPVTTYVLAVSGGTDTTGKGSYQAGETVTITADTAADGFAFSGWTASADVTFADASAATTTLTMPASDVTVTANYTAITPPEEQPETPVTTYVLAVSGGTDTTGKGSYQAGETVTITADAAADGFVFSGWTASADVTFADASAATTTLTMPASDVTVTANYTAVPVQEEKKPELTIKEIILPAVEEGYDQPAPYAVEITNVGNGDAKLTRLYPEGGSAGSFIVNETGRTGIAAGATDTSWTIQPVTGLSADTYTTQFVAEYDGLKAMASVTFTVNAKAPATYQLTVENGSGSGSYTEGASVPLSANAAADGMVFDQWVVSAGSVADVSSSETTFTMPAGDATVTATYKVKEKAKLGTPSITWSEDGATVSWTAVDGATGYKFYRVKVSGEETGKSTTSETSYTFQAIGQKGDVFYVKAIDANGNSLDGDYASATFE